MALSHGPLRQALKELNAELAAIETRTGEIRDAASALDRLLKTLEQEEPRVLGANEAAEDAAHADEAARAADIDAVPIPGPNGAGLMATPVPTPPPGRPLLRNAIPELLRVFPEGLTLKALADQLLQRGWTAAATEESRIESTRQAVSALRRNGVVDSETPDGEKAAVWRLSNVMLARPPAYLPAEAERGI